MNIGTRHYHKRKIEQRGMESGINRNKWAGVADKLVYAAGIITPLMTLPQIFTIWSGKNAAGVSLASWSFYLAGALMWVFYGLVHKEKPIIFTNGAMVAANAFVVLGILLYR